MHVLKKFLGCTNVCSWLVDRCVHLAMHTCCMLGGLKVIVPLFALKLFKTVTAAEWKSKDNFNRGSETFRLHYRYDVD